MLNPPLGGGSFSVNLYVSIYIYVKIPGLSPTYSAPVKKLDTERSEKTLKISNKRQYRYYLDIWIYGGRSAAFAHYLFIFYIAQRASLSMNTSPGLYQTQGPVFFELSIHDSSQAGIVTGDTL